MAVDDTGGRVLEASWVVARKLCALAVVSVVLCALRADSWCLAGGFVRKIQPEIGGLEPSRSLSS